ncbi:MULTISPECIES: hypothetical protein [Bradyrhizobium]|uniref:hypothetical protein n=1 Tax=Bradyrhizobium TaxID=374 RepID=UPI0011AE9C8E|nr:MULTISPECIES: hypothetical protein [Bradyrhizobium]MDE5458500.1 hypothetical protein [Bradyrhizobium sp. CSA112]
MAVDLALELGDPKLLLGDQSFVFRGFCTGKRERRPIPSPAFEYDLKARLKVHILRKTTELHKAAATEGIHRARRADLEDRGPERMIRTYPALMHSINNRFYQVEETDSKKSTGGIEFRHPKGNVRYFV